MIGTFITVALLTFKNRIVQRARRLREPRYLIGAIAGAVYFWFMFLRRAHNASHVLNGNLSFKPVIVDVASVVVLLMRLRPGRCRAIPAAWSSATPRSPSSFPHRYAAATCCSTRSSARSRN